MKITIDDSAVRGMLSKLGEDVRARVQADVVNEAARRGNTFMRQAIRDEFNMDAATIRAKLFVERASRKAGTLVEAEIYSRARGGKRAINLIRFVEKKVTLAEGRRRAKKGTLDQVHVKVLRRGKFKPVKDVFIGNKGRTLFQRLGPKRLPIEPAQVIDVPQMFNTERVKIGVVRLIRKALPEIAAKAVAASVARAQRAEARRARG